MTIGLALQRRTEPANAAAPRPARSRREPRDAASCACRRPDCHDAFALLASSTPADRRVLRNELVERHLELARDIAAHYRRGDVGFEDLAQVAAVALVRAVDRFEPERAIPFSAYAFPTIVGSLKQYYRDRGWTMRVPRRLKDRYVQMCAVSDELSQLLGRSPTVTELASRLDCSSDEIVEALHAGDAYQPRSLDEGGDGDTFALAEVVGAVDPRLDQLEEAESMRAVLGRLPARERHAVLLRFYGDMTQTQIAGELGCSQMQVSRLLRSALGRLRDELDRAGAP